MGDLGCLQLELTLVIWGEWRCDCTTGINYPPAPRLAFLATKNNQGFTSLGAVQTAGVQLGPPGLVPYWRCFGLFCTSDCRADVPTALGGLLLKHLSVWGPNDFTDLAPVFFLFLIFKEHCKIFQALYLIPATITITEHEVCCILVSQESHDTFAHNILLKGNKTGCRMTARKIRTLRHFE